MIEKFEKQLQIGGWILLAVLALSAVVLWQNIDRAGRAGNVSDTFAVSGTGKVYAKPDIGVADLAISVQGATSSTAQDEANKKSKTVIEYLKNAGIKSDDIKTSGYNIYPQYDYNNGRSRISGYQVTQSLTIKIRDLDKVNTIIDGVVDAGVNQVSSVRFEIDEPEKLQAEARAKAIAEAKGKAEELADQLGIRLGGIVNFYESSNYYPQIGYSERGGGEMMKTQSVSAPELPPGQNEISISVTITYQIR